MSVLVVVLVAYYKYGAEIGQKFGEISGYAQRGFKKPYVRIEREIIAPKKEKAYAPRKKLFEEFEKERLSRQVKEWKAKGYDTVLLEEELKGKVKPGEGLLEREKLLSQITDWKAGGYNTALLEAELQGRFKLKRKLSDAELKILAKRIRKWRSEGYDTALLEEEIEELLKK